MSIKEKKEQIKNWLKENKVKLIVGLTLITAGAMAAYVVNDVRKGDGDELILEEHSEESDQDRDIEIHYVDPETKEILWKEMCGEDYMNETKDSGMQYAEVRKLNGIEEA